MTKPRMFAWAAILLASCTAEAQDISPDLIRANLQYRIVQLRAADVQMGEITESAVAGLHEGTFTVNGNQTFRFLLSAERQELFLLALDPIDVGLTEGEIASNLEDERVAQWAEAKARLERLNDFSHGMPARGVEDAAITVHEFSDFQCPYCAQGFVTMEELIAKYPDDVRFVYLHFPLANHPWAEPAAIASVCAADQSGDAFWALHDAYFRAQKDITLENLLDMSREFLAGSGIDLDIWRACAGDDASAAHLGARGEVAASIAFGSSYGVSGTPGFFVNGHYLSGAQELETLEALMDEIRAEGAR